MSSSLSKKCAQTAIYDLVFKADKFKNNRKSKKLVDIFFLASGGDANWAFSLGTPCMHVSVNYNDNDDGRGFNIHGSGETKNIIIVVH